MPVPFSLLGFHYPEYRSLILIIGRGQGFAQRGGINGFEWQCCGKPPGRCGVRQRRPASAAACRPPHVGRPVLEQLGPLVLGHGQQATGSRSCATIPCPIGPQIVAAGRFFRIWPCTTGGKSPLSFRVPVITSMKQSPLTTLPAGIGLWRALVKPLAVDVRLPKILTDHMMLQQNAEVTK